MSISNIDNGSAWRLPALVWVYLWHRCAVWPAVRVCIWISGAVSRMAYGAALGLMRVQIWVLQLAMTARRAGWLVGDLVRLGVSLVRLAVAASRFWILRARLGWTRVRVWWWRDVVKPVRYAWQSYLDGF